MPIHQILGLGLALVISFLAVLIHYEALGGISVLTVRAPVSPRLKMLGVIFAVVIAHMVEAGVFAFAFWLGAAVMHLGRFVGDAPQNAFQYYYFALETYTTQSVGDLYPIGGLRVVASLEPLVGLILIGWSTSFSFVVMRRYWRLKPSPR
ncbi:ion channel [Phenylobacterium sp.]|jgi:hypothetical protein|uniref:ion channel n=1 Tax=Phenylobacterium sp. TaxID=1871053 RepID=UPI002E32598F|nr:ion channel [Phenylobacterium sp.]HEX3366422.1 ion channel [Phenylobacterium sp.]